MTIVISPARAAQLATLGQTNNPFVTPAVGSGTISTTTGTPVASPANALSGWTYDPWIATPSGGSVELQYVFTGNQNISMAAIAAHNLSDVGGTIRLQYSLDSGSTWITTGAGGVSPTDNQAIAFRCNENVSTRYWRLAITGAGANVSIAVAFFGYEIIIPQRIYQGYAPPITPNVVDLNTNVSEGAHLLGAAFTKRGSTFGADFTHIDPEFIRGANWSSFQDRWNRGNGAFWGWRPGKYGDLYYAWRQGAVIAPQNSGPRDYMSFSIQARAYDDD